MEWRAGRTRVRLHPLTLLLPVLASTLGLSNEVAAMALSLALHEGAHLLSARLAGVRVESVSLMPFGGTARLGNLYALSTGQVLFVAAAGPLANILVLTASAALCQWGALSPMAALTLMRVNLLLALFNLLPALPLDGGRVLYGLLAGRLGRTRAVDIGIGLGRVAAAALLALTVIGVIRTHRLNVSTLASAIFIVASAPGEREALGDARVSSLLNAVRPMGGPVPMHVCAVDARCPARRALRHAQPDAATLYAVYESGRLTGFTDDRRLVEALLVDRDALVNRTSRQDETVS